MGAIYIWWMAIGIGCAASAVFYVLISRWMKSEEHPSSGTVNKIDVNPALDEVDEHDGNRLSRAVCMDDVNAFKLLVGESPSLAQQYTFHRARCVHTEECSTLNYIVECARGGQNDLIKPKKMFLFAIESGADINARAPNNGWTPLEAAIFYERYLMIPFLIQHGARPVEGPRVDAVPASKMLWAFFRQNGGWGKVGGVELLEIVDALTSIGLVEKNQSNPTELIFEFANSAPDSEDFVEVIKRLLKCGLEANKAEIDIMWLWRLLDDKIDNPILQNGFIDDLVESGFELIDCGNIDIQHDCIYAKTSMELLAQVDAAKAKKEKKILLRELAIGTEEVEVRPKRRM